MESKQKLQTILGVGSVGIELAKVLPQYTSRIRLVERDPRKVNPSDELLKADLTDAEQTSRAVQSSDIVYLTVGIPYSTKTWGAEWPLVMENVITACKKHGAKLVFFDNVYLYGKVEGWMTEESPVHPCSKKGEIRARIADMLMQEMKSGTLRALIVRSADFYGPAITSGMPTAMIFKRLQQGKAARWMLNDAVKHSFTYVPDAVRAMALLANTPDAYGQVWHAPTDKNALTGKEFITLAARSLGVPSRYDVLSKTMLRFVGFFMPVVRENREMLYQNEFEYLFDSSKFNLRFPEFKTTPYAEGIRAAAKNDE